MQLSCKHKAVLNPRSQFKKKEELERKAVKQQSSLTQVFSKCIQKFLKSSSAYQMVNKGNKLYDDEDKNKNTYRDIFLVRC